MMEIPVIGLAKFITDLAAKHNVRYVETYLDRFAEAVNQLTDKVKQDDIDYLLLALLRAEIITKDEWFELLCNYLRESREAGHES